MPRALSAPHCPNVRWHRLIGLGTLVPRFAENCHRDLFLLSVARWLHDDSSVVSAEESRRVLETLVSTYPGTGVIVGLRLWSGWGNSLQIEIDTRHEPGTSVGEEHRVAEEIRRAILESMAPNRTVVTFAPLLTDL
jgi:hypothetical protein